MRLDLVEPRLKRQERLGPQTEDAQASIIPNPFIGDEPRLEQDSQVSAHNGSRGARGLSELAGAVGAVAQKLDNAPSCRIGECCKRSLQVLYH